MTVDWKAEAELLRAQLVQCTTAMREVSTEMTALLTKYSAIYPEPCLAPLVSKLDEARGKPVSPDLVIVTYDERESIQYLIDKASEWENKYRKLALENVAKLRERYPDGFVAGGGKR